MEDTIIGTVFIVLLLYWPLRAMQRNGLFVFLFGAFCIFYVSVIVWLNYELLDLRVIYVLAVLLAFRERLTGIAYMATNIWFRAGSAIRRLRRKYADSEKAERVYQESNSSSQSSRADNADEWKRKAEQAEYRERQAREEARRAREEAYRANEQKTGTSSKEVDKRTPEEILGLKPGFSKDELKKAYKREAGRFHENKWQGKPESVQKAMQEELKKINAARDQLERQFY